MPEPRTWVDIEFVEMAGEAVYGALREHRCKGGSVSAANVDHLVAQGVAMVRDALVAAALLATADLEEEA